MVVDLKAPTRPLPRGGTTWSWLPRTGAGNWHWCRVYHQGAHNQNGHTPRTFGPLYRFDPHRPGTAGVPHRDPDGRSVLYLGSDLATSLCEVFGEAEHAALCPRWRAAALEPSTRLRLFDLRAPGSAMAIGALPALADAALPRALTQEWARAIYEDQPASYKVTGIRYRSAYNGGISLVLWDSANDATTVHETGGKLADVALADPTMLTRVRAACTPRRITVKTIASIECGECLKNP